MQIFHQFFFYSNVARPNSQFELSTRFIALASVGNPAKNKFIYALSVTPVDKMRLTDLIQKTTNELPCPYDSMKFGIEHKSSDDSKGNQYFYDFNAPDQRNNRKKRGGLGYEEQKQKRPRQQNIDQGRNYVRFRLKAEYLSDSFFYSRKMLVLLIVTIR